MEALSKRKLKVWLFQFIINCNSTTCIRISMTLYQKPKVNSRNHRALQTIQFYEAFRMTLKNGFLKCSLFILSVNRWWQDDDPLNGEKYLSCVRLATQYLFPMSWKINFQQSFFFKRDYFCLFDRLIKFLCSFLFVVLFCLFFFCLFFPCVYNRFKVNRHSLLTIRQADNWMI